MDAGQRQWCVNTSDTSDMPSRSEQCSFHFCCVESCSALTSQLQDAWQLLVAAALERPRALLLLAALSLPATLAMIGGRDSQRAAKSFAGSDELRILQAMRVQACLMVTLFHLLFVKFFSGIPGGPWDEVLRSICKRHTDVFFVLSVYLAVVRSKKEVSGGPVEQIAVSGATLLRRVARVGPFLFVRAACNVTASRSVWDVATDKMSWLGGWPYCQEFVCYAAVQSLLLARSFFGEVSAVAGAIAGIAYCQHYRMAIGKIVPKYETEGHCDLWIRHLPCSLVVFLISHMLTRSRGVGKTQEPMLEQKSRSQCLAAMVSCLVHLCYHSGILLTGLLDWCYAFGPCDMLSDWHRPLLHTLPLALGCLVLLEHHRKSPQIQPSWTWLIEMLDGVSVSWMHIHMDVIWAMGSLQSLPTSRLALLAQAPSLLAWTFLACKVHTWMVAPYKQGMLKAVVKLETLATSSQIKLGAWILLVGLAGLCFQGSLQLCKQVQVPLPRGP